MYKCGKNVTCNFGEVFFVKEYCMKNQGFLKSLEYSESPGRKMYRLMMYLHYICDITLMYTLHRDKRGAEKSFIKVERSRENIILRYVHNEFQSNAMIRICICVLSLKTHRC